MRELRLTRLPPSAAVFTGVVVVVALLLTSTSVSGALVSENNVVPITTVSPSLTQFFSHASGGILQRGIQSIFQVPGLSESCSRDMSRLVEQISPIVGQPKGDETTQIEAWALQMIDAWGKIPEGVLSGHVNSLGDYDECLAIRAPPMKGQDDSHPDSKPEPFQGKYCLVYVVPNVTLPKGLPLSQDPFQGKSSDRTVENLLRILSIVGNAELPLVPTIGSCLPSTCSDQEIFQISYALLSHVNLIPVTSFCSIDEPPRFSSGAIATIAVIGVLVTFVLLGTVADLGVKYEYLSPSLAKTNLHRILLAFSVPSNGRKFLNTNTSPSDVSCLHGIRFLSASWVVLGHTYLLGIMQPLWNIVDTFTMVTSSLSILVIINAAIVVDVFFVIGGFLVSLTLLGMIQKAKGKINIPMLYIHRYLRITPLYMFIVAFGTFIFPLMGSGPNWHVAKTWAGFCEKNWWKNMLYINNLPIYDTLNDPSDAPCHGMAWYLGVDMQLFVLSPFLLYPIWKWKKYGKIPLVFVTLGSIILPGVLTYTNDYLPTSIPFKDRENEYSQYAYTPTYMRAAPYLIGMCAGLLYHSIQNKAFKLQRSIVIGAWLLAFAVGFTVLLSPQKFYNPDYQFNPIESAIYVSGHRTAWSLAISWLIVACATGYGGWINQFLSWRPFVPLGRLTFAVYLVSMHLQFLFHLQYRVPIYFDKYHFFNLYLGHLVMSCIVALVLTLVVEAPLMQLLKILLPTKSPKSKSDDIMTHNNNNDIDNPNRITIRIERCSVSPAPSGRSEAESSKYGSTNVLTASQDKLIA